MEEQEIIFAESSVSKELCANRILEREREAMARAQNGVTVWHVLGTTGSSVTARIQSAWCTMIDEAVQTSGGHAKISLVQCYGIKIVFSRLWETAGQMTWFPQ